MAEEDGGSSLALESLSQLLESLTVAQLKEVGKIATKAIRKVPLENILVVHEVATCNPLFRYLEHLKSIDDGEGDENREEISISKTSSLDGITWMVGPSIRSGVFV